MNKLIETMPARIRPHELSATQSEEHSSFDCSKTGVVRRLKKILSNSPKGTTVVLENVSTKAQRLITPILQSIAIGTFHTRAYIDVLNARNYAAVKELVDAASSAVLNEIIKEDSEVMMEEESDEENDYESENEEKVRGYEV